MRELSDNNPYAAVGKRLTRHRIDIGIRAEKMAQDFGITWGTYQRIEAGLAELLDYSHVISTTLQCSQTQLESLLSTETAVDKLKRVNAIEALLARSTEMLVASQKDVFRMTQIIDDIVAAETAEKPEYH